MDHLKKAEKDDVISEDDHRSQSDRVQKMTDETISTIDSMLGGKRSRDHAGLRRLRRCPGSRKANR